jgi:hypothetical protein
MLLCAMLWLLVSSQAAAQTITLSPSSLPSATVGAAYNETIMASGGTLPYTYAITAGALPAGLSLSTSTGALSGTPTAGGSFSFTVSSTGTGPYTGDRNYTLTISTLPLPCGVCPWAEAEQALEMR